MISSQATVCQGTPGKLKNYLNTRECQKQALGIIFPCCTYCIVSMNIMILCENQLSVCVCIHVGTYKTIEGSVANVLGQLAAAIVLYFIGKHLDCKQNKMLYGIATYVYAGIQNSIT